MIIKIQENPTIIVNSEENPIIIVNPDYQPLTVTGNSYYRFVGVAPAIVTDVQTGNLHTIGISVEISSTGHSNSYNDLRDKPLLFDGDYLSLNNKPLLFDGNYLSLSNKPSLAIYQTVVGISGITLQQSQVNGLQAALNAKSSTGHGHSYNVLTDKPTLFDGNYLSLNNKPLLFDGDYLSLSNKPSLAIYQTVVGISGITLQQSQVNGLQAALNANSSTGHTHSQYTVIGVTAQLQLDVDSHTLDNSIHFKISGITLQQSQVDGLQAALNAKSSTGHGHSYNALTDKPLLFDGDYLSLNNKPTLFDGDYLSLNNKPLLFDGDYLSLNNKPTLFSGGYNDLTDKPLLFDGDYLSLSNKPSLAIYQTIAGITGITLQQSQVDGLQAALAGKSDTEHGHSYNVLTDKPTLFDGDYLSLNNKPSLAIYQTISGITGITLQQSQVDGLQAALNAKSSTVHGHSYNTLSDKPTLFDGNYLSLSNKPTLFDGDYLSLSNKPTLAIYQTIAGISGITLQQSQVNGLQVALAGKSNTEHGHSYNALTDKPTLFDGDYLSLNNKPLLFSGSYNALTDKPTLFDGDYLSLNNKPLLFSGSYNDLSNKPTLFDGISGATNLGIGESIYTVVVDKKINLKSITATNLTLTNTANTINIAAGSIATKSFWTGTEAQYTAIGTYDSNTIYFCTT